MLAHRLSLLATYAGAMEYRPDAPPEQLARAAGCDPRRVHHALEELREVIALLRHDEDGLRRRAAGARRPTALVDEAREAGSAVPWRTSSGRRLPADDGPYRLPGGPGGADQRPQARRRAAGPGRARRRARRDR